MDDMKDNKDKIERPFSFLSDLVGKRVNVRVLFTLLAALVDTLVYCNHLTNT